MGSVRVVMMQRDEGDMLSRWLSHYGGLFGLDKLYPGVHCGRSITDRTSRCRAARSATPRLSALAQQSVPGHRGPGEGVHRVKTLSMKTQDCCSHYDSQVQIYVPLDGAFSLLRPCLT
jgi:hypothetical protein